MRTVHETEALRPSDPVPKSMQPFMKTGTRIKMTIKQQSENGDASSLSPGNPRDHASDFVSANHSEQEQLNHYHSEATLTPSEHTMEPKDLWRLLRRQIHWAEEEAEELLRECDMVEEIRKKEWAEKEVLLDQVINNEMDWHERRKLVLATQPSAADIKAQILTQMDTAIHESQETLEAPKEDQQEAAAVLASLSQA